MYTFILISCVFFLKMIQECFLENQLNINCSNFQLAFFEMRSSSHSKCISTLLSRGQYEPVNTILTIFTPKYSF